MASNIASNQHTPAGGFGTPPAPGNALIVAQGVGPCTQVRLGDCLTEGAHINTEFPNVPEKCNPMGLQYH